MSWKILVWNVWILGVYCFEHFFFFFELSTSCCIFSRFAVFSNVFYVFSRFAVFSHILSVLSRVLLYFLFILACFSHLFLPFSIEWVFLLQICQSKLCEMIWQTHKSVVFANLFIFVCLFGVVLFLRHRSMNFSLSCEWKFEVLQNLDFVKNETNFKEYRGWFFPLTYCFVQISVVQHGDVRLFAQSYLIRCECLQFCEFSSGVWFLSEWFLYECG